jgi:hypothetical protein
MDPRDISIQIEEEIRAGSSTQTNQAKEPKVSKRDRSSVKKESEPSGSKAKTEVCTFPHPKPLIMLIVIGTTQSTEAEAVKPKRQRAWKEAKKEAKRRRTEAKETGQLPRKEAERQTKSKSDSKPEETPKVRKRDSGDEGAQSASKRKDGKAGKESKKRKV